MIIISQKYVATEWDGGWFCDHCQTLQHYRVKAHITDKNEKICKKCLTKEEVSGNILRRSARGRETKTQPRKKLKKLEKSS